MNTNETETKEIWLVDRGLFPQETADRIIAALNATLPEGHNAMRDTLPYGVHIGMEVPSRISKAQAVRNFMRAALLAIR